MKPAVLLLLSLLILLPCLLPPAAAASEACGELLDFVYEDQQRGIQRSYSVYRPCRLREHPPALFLFHFTGGSGWHMLWTTDIYEEADRYGFLAVLPDAFTEGPALPPRWNDQRGWRSSFLDSLDEMPFVAGMVTRLRAEFDIDTGRLFAAGLANGGGLSLSLACRGGEMLESHGFRFAGVASVGSSLPSFWHGERCAPLRSTRLLLVNGTHDVFARWCDAEDRQRVPVECAGTDPSGSSTEFRGEMDSVYKTREFFENRLGCWSAVLPPFGQRPIDSVPTDGTDLRIHFGTCARGSLRFYRINRGGHNWPPNPIEDPEGFPDAGRISREMDVNQVLVEFFQLASPGWPG